MRSATTRRSRRSSGPSRAWGTGSSPRWLKSGDQPAQVDALLPESAPAGYALPAGGGDDDAARAAGVGHTAGLRPYGAAPNRQVRDLVVDDAVGDVRAARPLTATFQRVAVFVIRNCSTSGATSSSTKSP